MTEEKLLTLNDLFVHKLRDLYDSQSRLVEVFPEFINKISDENLRRAVNGHLNETKQDQARIKEISNKLNINPEGVACEATKGLIQEAQEILNAKANPDVLDAGIISVIQSIAHYEIAGFGTARNYAKLLKQQEAFDFFDQAVQEEKEIDGRLTELALKSVNEEALNA